MQKDRRKNISKPKVFNEKRDSMLLIKTASPADIYIWAVSLMFISVLLATFLIISFIK
jgi:hypothetical protein